MAAKDVKFGVDARDKMLGNVPVDVEIGGQALPALSR